MLDTCRTLFPLFRSSRTSPMQSHRSDLTNNRCPCTCDHILLTIERKRKLILFGERSICGAHFCGCTHLRMRLPSKPQLPAEAKHELDSSLSSWQRNHLSMCYLKWMRYSLDIITYDGWMNGCDRKYVFRIHINLYIHVCIRSIMPRYFCLTILFLSPSIIDGR